MTPSQERREALDAAIVRDYNAFKPVDDIMKAHGVAKSTVFNVLKRNGIQLGRAKLTIVQKLEQALRPFVESHEKHRDAIGDSDLYDEQPVHVSVTLGDCRRAWFALKALQDLRESPKWKPRKSS